MLGNNLNTNAKVNPNKKKRLRSEREIWYCMQQRCYNPNNDGYYLYGARGITICAGWKIFNNFIADVGPRPSMEHSIDRADNDGGYWCGKCAECLANGWPTNARWVDRQTQFDNRRNTLRFTHNGITQTLQRWAEQTGIPYMTMFCRLKRGWSSEEILSEPNQHRVRKKYS